MWFSYRAASSKWPLWMAKRLWTMPSLSGAEKLLQCQWVSARMISAGDMNLSLHLRLGWQVLRVKRNIVGILVPCSIPLYIHGMILLFHSEPWTLNIPYEALFLTTDTFLVVGSDVRMAMTATPPSAAWARVWHWATHRHQCRLRNPPAPQAAQTYTVRHPNLNLHPRSRLLRLLPRPAPQPQRRLIIAAVCPRKRLLE